MRLCRQRQELQRYREVVETATDAVVTIDESHRILFFNKAAESMFGFSKGEVIDQDLELIIPSPHKEAHREYVRRYVETRFGRYIDHTVELTAEKRSGEEFPISISFSVTEESGHLLMTAIIRDITELKALQQKAIQNERLASMGQALSYVTHEIKNPLVSIGGFARSLLQSSSIQEKDLGRLDIIVKEVRRLEELLAEIQDFSKPLIMEKQGLQILAFFRDTEESSQVTFSLDVHGDPVIHADPDRLRQVMLNLIKNAMESIEMMGKIRIRAWKDDRTSTIEIQDNGHGIDRNHLEIIFDPFFTTKREGTGLGLPLCRKIIREHGGELTIQSTIAQGTSARITLPAHDS
jgi:PAS domain S-box-containing protein